jgi:hypothetical protein
VRRGNVGVASGAWSFKTPIIRAQCQRQFGVFATPQPITRAAQSWKQYPCLTKLSLRFCKRIDPPSEDSLGVVGLPSNLGPSEPHMRNETSRTNPAPEARMQIANTAYRYKTRLFRQHRPVECIGQHGRDV